VRESRPRGVRRWRELWRRFLLLGNLAGPNWAPSRGKMTRGLANLVKLIRRRDRAVCDAEVVRIGDETSLPMLLIEGEPFPAAETAGYFILEVSVAELAELKRGGYRLLRALEPSGLRASPD